MRKIYTCPPQISNLKKKYIFRYYYPLPDSEFDSEGTSVDDVQVTLMFHIFNWSTLGKKNGVTMWTTLNTFPTLWTLNRKWTFTYRGRIINFFILSHLFWEKTYWREYVMKQVFNASQLRELRLVKINYENELWLVSTKNSELNASVKCSCPRCTSWKCLEVYTADSYPRN